MIVEENSYAHTFAEANNILFVLFEDGAEDIEAGIYNDYTYCIINGCAIIMAYSGTETDIVIPDEINGSPVTELQGTGVFKNNQTLLSVKLPKDLKVVAN